MIHQQFFLTPEEHTKLAALEAILFTMGTAVESRKLAAALECEEEHVHELAGYLKEQYEREEHPAALSGSGFYGGYRYAFRLDAL